MQRSDADPIFEAALEWMLRLDGEPASSELHEAFDAWIASSAEHAAAYERAQALWGRFDIVRPEAARLRQMGRLPRRAVLGGLALLLAGPALYVATRPGLFATYRTGVGERMQASLADGSIVELGGRTALSVDYSDTGRRLVLHEGQAFFRVIEEPARPFIVTAGSGTVTALGTEFDIKIEPDRTTVVVVEHSVSVARPGGKAVTVEEGWEVSFADEAIGTPRQANIASVEAWRSDRLVFEDVALRRVVAELERYRNGSIVIVDGRVGDLPLTAIFDARHTENALQRIAEILPIQVLDGAGLVTFIYAR